MISVDMVNLIMVFLNFLILLILLQKFLYKPLMEFLDKRANLIKENIEEAKKKRAEAEALFAKYEEQLKNARKEAEKIINKSVEEGRKIAKQIEEDARKDAQRIQEDAEKQIQLAIKKGKEEIKTEIIKIVMLATGKIVNDRFTSDLDEEYIADTIAKLENLEEI